MRDPRPMVLVATLALSACSAGSGWGLRVGFASGPLGAQTARVVVAVRREGCASGQDVDWSRALQVIDIAPGETGTLAPVDDGRYAVLAIAVDASCRAIGASCIDAELPAPGSPPPELTLAPLPDPFCAAVGGCAASCEGDGGSGDGGVRHDAGDPLSYSDAVIGDGALVYWRLDERSDARESDATGNGFFGTYREPVERGVAGALASDPSPGARFVYSAPTGGAVERVDGTAIYGDGAVTFEMWLRPGLPPTAEPESAVLLAESYLVGGFRLYMSGSTLALEVWPPDAERTGDLRSSVELAADEYAHVVLQCDDDGCRFFVDGAEAGRIARRLVPAGSSDLIVGGGHGLPSAVTIDELAIYDRTLSPEAIALHHRIGREGPVCP
jgi:hypothetical protein